MSVKTHWYNGKLPIWIIDYAGVISLDDTRHVMTRTSTLLEEQRACILIDMSDIIFSMEHHSRLADAAANDPDIDSLDHFLDAPNVYQATIVIPSGPNHPLWQSTWQRQVDKQRVHKVRMFRERDEALNYLIDVCSAILK